MKHITLPCLVCANWIVASSAATSMAGEMTANPAPATPADAWERFNDWSIADMLFPNVHIHGVGGASSGEIEALEPGGHDPKRESFSAQAIEPGLSLRTKYVEGFANYLFYQDANGDWDGELEEAFGKIVNIPGGFELKGGQYLSRFGIMNDKHLHAWDFVDSQLVLSRFLGDDGLKLQGGEVSWTLPFGMDPMFVSIATLGYGNALSHEHGHHEHEEEADEPLHAGEEGALADDIWTARLMGRYRFDDFHSITAGISGAGGTNGFGRDTQVFGLDAEYLWRENGLEKGGRALRIRGELLWRDVDAYSVHEEENEVHAGNYQEWGFYTNANYTWNSHWDTALGLGWVQGIDDLGQDERFRISPSVSYWFDSGRRIGIRAQYNHEILSGGKDENSVWFQLNIALGSAEEVR